MVTSREPRDVSEGSPLVRDLLANLMAPRWTISDFMPLLERAVGLSDQIGAEKQELARLQAWMNTAPNPACRFLVDLVLGLGGVKLDLVALRRDFINLFEKHYGLGLTLFSDGQVLAGFADIATAGHGPGSEVIQFGRWFARLRTDVELLRCGQCETLMVPTFKRIDTYVCPNDECAQEKCIYNCWSCSAIIESDDDILCDACGWYVCRNCGCCLAGLAHGCPKRKPRSAVGAGQIEVMKDMLNAYRFGRIYNQNFEQFRANPAFQWIDLARGTIVLSSKAQLCAYMVKYGAMHFWKLIMALGWIREVYVSGDSWSLVDWGCGQGIGTMAVCELATRWKGDGGKPRNVMLVEPSSQAMEAACKYLHEEFALNPSRRIVSGFDTLDWKNLPMNEGLKLHLFSNILDVAEYDLDRFCLGLASRLSGRNVFVCIGPNHMAARDRCDRFVRNMNIKGRNMTVYGKTQHKLFAESYDLSARRVVQRPITRYGIAFGLDL